MASGGPQESHDYGRSPGWDISPLSSPATVQDETQPKMTGYVAENQIMEAETHNSFPSEYARKEEPKYGIVKGSFLLRFKHYLWLWELGASILSLVCIASIAAVASSQQGKPLDEWRRGIGKNISPTAVVSFLGAIGKSACLVALASIVSQLKWMHFTSSRKLSDLQLFDDASRGPMGAFLMIILKNRTAMLASLASFVILASLLLDPFVQLIFDFPSELRPISQADGAETKAPRIQTTRTYDPAGLWRNYGSCYGPTRVESSVQAAMLAPVWNSLPPPELPCPFEKCEWPTITTLGVCSSCEDVTEDVTTECSIPDRMRPRVECNNTIESINTTLQSEFGLLGGAASPLQSYTVWNSTAFPAAESLRIDESKPPTIAEFASIRLAEGLVLEDYLSNTEVRLLKDLEIEQAMHCSLTLCARTFDNPYYANFSAGPLSGRETPLKFASVPDRPEFALQYVTLVPEDAPDNAPAEDTFTFNFCNYIDLADYLASLFTLEYLSNGRPTASDQTVSSTGPTRQKVTPNIGFILSQTKDMAALMRSMAGSMTEALRTSANSTTVQGTGLNTVTYIHIEWAWLSLPLAVVTLAFVMLVTVILRNRARGIPAWKSSSLALLFHELEGWDASQRAELHGPLEVEKRAEGMRARVASEGGLLAFSKA